MRAIALGCSALIPLGFGMATAGASNPPGSVHGFVVDTFTKTSLYGVCIKAVSETDPTIVRTIQSAGSYTLTDLPPDVYDITGQSCAGTIPAYGGPDSIHAVTVTAGSNISLPFLNLTRTISPFPYGSILGSVLDATTHAPLAGICVTGPADGRVAGPSARQTTVTDANGAYRFDNVVPLSYTEAEFRDCPGLPPAHQANSVHGIVGFGPIPTAMLAGLLATNGGTPPPTKPATPANVQATRAHKSHSATVTWTEPTSGGTATSFVITTYSVGSPKVFGTPVTVTGAVRSSSVGGLHIGHRYSFTVTAANTVGASAPSAPSNRV